MAAQPRCTLCGYLRRGSMPRVIPKTSIFRHRGSACAGTLDMRPPSVRSKKRLGSDNLIHSRASSFTSSKPKWRRQPNKRGLPKPLRHLSSDGSACGGGAMPSPEEYRARAKYFLEMASTADTWVANFLRLTAADYGACRRG